MRRGGTLLEIVVAAGILALAIPLVLNLLPTGLLSLRKAESLQISTSLAFYRMDEARLLAPRSGPQPVELVQIGPQTFTLAREFYQVDAQRWDVVVVCQPQGLAPVRLATRLVREAP